MAEGIGTEDVLSHAPREISVMQYAEARASEIEAMAKASSTRKSNKLVNQLLPRHMRRRAASHNVKRLPRRLQQAAKKEMDKNLPVKTKRPSRRHRRRPGNLLQEYSRRQRTHVWLETHIWHAKRFHMTEAWGYKLPLHPNDKGVRAAYRAAAHHCLLQDMSYLCCIEVRGPVDAIKQGVQRMTSPSLGPAFCAAAYTQGTREGSTVLYKCDKYPLGALGEVKFLWNALNVDDETGHRQLWLWAHPACYNDMLNELTSALEVTLKIEVEDKVRDPQSKNSTKDTESEASAGIKRKAVEALDTEPSKKGKSSCDGSITIQSLKTSNPVYQNDMVTVTSLKDTLCRFRLTGPGSAGVLVSALHIGELVDTELESGDLETTKLTWWEKLYSASAWREAHSEQQKMWQMMDKIGSPAELTPHCVLGLTVRDPRVFIPQKRARPGNDVEGDTPSKLVKPWQQTVSLSPLWQRSVRHEVNRTKMSEQEFNRRRSQLLVPGSQLNLGKEESRLPVLLVQNPGVRSSPNHARSSNKMLGFGSGWDLILPGGWAMAFWISLVYRGARATGLKQLNSLSLEQAVLQFPEDYPDTPACKALEAETQQKLQAKYDRMPPAKRPNYVKLGVTSPFCCPWSDLVNEWLKRAPESPQQYNDSMLDGQPTTEAIDYTVLRCRKSLAQVSRAISGGLIRSNSTASKSEILERVVAGRTQVDINFKELLTSHPCCLVPVYIKCQLRGTPDDFSMICIPSLHDLQSLAQDPHYGGPAEPVHQDKTGRKKKGSSKSQVVKPPMVSATQAVDTQVTKSDREQKCVVESCSRPVIGYVKHGGFAFSSGHGCGIGFVALPGLVQLVSQTTKHKKVLIRSPASRQYRFGDISVMGE